MISNSATIATAEFERQTGWSIEPEGACKDGRCLPLPEPPSDTIDLPVIAAQLNMPLITDDEAGLWCLGPEAGGRALASAVAPDGTNRRTPESRQPSPSANGSGSSGPRVRTVVNPIPV